MTAAPGTGPRNTRAADEDVAAVLAVLAALAGSTAEPTTPATRSVWGRPDRHSTPGADAWWASGLPQ